MKISKLYAVICIAASVFASSCVKEEMPADMESVQSSVERPSDEDVVAEKAILRSLLSNRDTKWTADDLDIPALNGEWYEVGTAKELAFLLEFGSTKGEKYRLAEDIDVSSCSIADKFRAEIGAESFENFEFDGNGKTISGLDLPWAAGVFSVVKNSKIYSLTIADSKVGSEANVSNLNGTGVLVGCATGTLHVSDLKILSCQVSAPCKVGGVAGSLVDVDATFSRCDVNDTDVSTIYVKGVSGWCGGFTGFVGRKAENSSVTTVSVVAENCSVAGGNVKAHMESSTRYSGTFIGALNGYDANEVVDMKNCQVSTTFVGLDDKAASSVSIYPDRKIGGHKYMNGHVSFDGLEFVTPWDGITVSEPILVDDAYQVYTGEELAWFQGKTVTQKIRICKDIDLGGHNFAPIYKAQYIDGFKSEGKNYEIRNLKVVREKCGKEDGGAFIRQASGTTVHKNITFRGADISAFHDPAAEHGNAYCATLCGNMTGTYTMENVHAYDGKLYGVNKMGGLLGRLAAESSTVTNCSVSGYEIINYEVNDKPEDFAKIATDKGIYCSECIFYPHGEIGGFIGFVSSNSNISDCSVVNTVIEAKGQVSQSPKIGLSSLISTNVKIAGRYVNEFIGNIRTDNKETVTISNIETNGNSYTADSWIHSDACPIVGGIYYVPVLDEKGTVTYNGKSVSF